MRVVIAARKSDLAKIQAYQVGHALISKNPHLDIQYHFRESLGDINNEDPLWKMPERGVFTEDFHQGLISGEWDMVVHSWKDLPVEDRIGTELAATLPREDQRDLLLFKKSSYSRLLDSSADIQLLSSSPRRAYNLQKALPKLLPGLPQKLQFTAVRGNIQTRVRKLLEGPADGLIVAKAALDRLLSSSQEEFSTGRRFLGEALDQLHWMVLPLSVNPTAAAQGALAVEIKRERPELQQLLASIHHAKTFVVVQEERRQLKNWGGGCHQKIGISILDRPFGRITWAQGERDNGELIDTASLQTHSSSTRPGDFYPKEKASNWFTRESLPLGDDVSAFNAHWISKAHALPDSVNLSRDAIIWTAGLKSWESLAQRGLWVNGTADSLGEQEDEKISVLAGRELHWCKWTHDEGEMKSRSKTPLKTYKLRPNESLPMLNENTQHFLWMSGSAFKLAIKQYPWLKDKDHWCGPGHTWTLLKEEMKKSGGLGTVSLALSYEEWQKKMQTIPRE